MTLKFKKQQKPYDKLHESNQQMLLRIAKKFGIIFLIILMFDSLLEALMAITDVLIEIAHLFIEFIEYSVEVIFEYLFHASHHQSEIIIVNIVIISCLYGFYKLCFMIPKLFIQLEEFLLTKWLKYKEYEWSCWQALPLTRKVEVIFMYSLGVTAILFMLTL